VLLQVQALLVASHYKNTPNDLLLLADAPAHQLYVLLGPVDETQNALPDVLVVVQVGLMVHCCGIEVCFCCRWALCKRGV
jgi:N-acetyltransferase 10